MRFYAGETWCTVVNNKPFVGVVNGEGEFTAPTEADTARWNTETIVVGRTEATDLLHVS